MTKSRLAVLSTLLLAVACSVRRPVVPPVAPQAAEAAPVAPAREETREDRQNRRRDAILAAPPCALPPPADTIGWRAASTHPRLPLLRLPPEFRPDTTAEFYHGGVQWRAGARTFFAQNGWWAVYASNACRATFLSGEYIVQQREVDGQLALSAFPADTVWRPSILIGGRATTQAELRVLWSILRFMPPFPSP